jgi:hypothetical protein
LEKGKKILQDIGASCPNRINLHLEFDRSYRKISEEITGGRFITKDEYQS